MALLYISREQWCHLNLPDFMYYLMVLIVFWYICLLQLYFHLILPMHFQFLISARQCESHRVNPSEILFLWKEFITGQKARYIKQELHCSSVSNNIYENALLHIDLIGLKAYTQLICAFYVFGSYGKVLAVSCIIFGRWLLLDLILSLRRDLPEPPMYWLHPMPVWAFPEAPLNPAVIVTEESHREKAPWENFNPLSSLITSYNARIDS